MIVRLRWPIVLAWAAPPSPWSSTSESAGGGRRDSLVGLVPKDAESIEVGLPVLRLFDVPVISHAHVVQRSPDQLSEAALRRVARRAKRVADARDPELEGIAFALPLVNEEQVVPGSREPHDRDHVPLLRSTPASTTRRS